MASKNMRSIHIAILAILFITSNVLLRKGDAAGECGRNPLPAAAVSMTPCLGAARNTRTRVSPLCCSKVAALIKTAPKCLCAVILSSLARQVGINPGIAITIPKRCNIRNRPTGNKCGRYTVP